MLRQLFLVVLVACYITPYQSIPIEERTDDAGVEWVGPIRKCPMGNDKVLDECLTNIVRDLTPLVGTGIEELGLQPLDPISLDKFDYEQNLGPIRFSVIARNVKIHDLPKYRNLRFKVDTNERVMRFVYEVPSIKLDTDYKLGGNVFFFPLKGSGPAHLELFGMKVAGHMNFYKTENENGDKVIQLKDTVVDHMSIKDMTVRIRGLFDGNPLFSAVAHYIGNRYGPEIFEIAKPDVAKHTGDVITNLLLNPILSKLPYIAEYVPDN